MKKKILALFIILHDSPGNAASLNDAAPFDHEIAAVHTHLTELLNSPHEQQEESIEETADTIISDEPQEQEAKDTETEQLLQEKEAEKARLIEEKKHLLQEKEAEKRELILKLAEAEAAAARFAEEALDARLAEEERLIEETRLAEEARQQAETEIQKNDLTHYKHYQGKNLALLEASASILDEKLHKKILPAEQKEQFTAQAQALLEAVKKDDARFDTHHFTNNEQFIKLHATLKKQRKEEEDRIAKGAMDLTQIHTPEILHDAHKKVYRDAFETFFMVKTPKEILVAADIIREDLKNPEYGEALLRGEALLETLEKRKLKTGWKKSGALLKNNKHIEALRDDLEAKDKEQKEFKDHPYKLLKKNPERALEDDIDTLEHELKKRRGKRLGSK